MTTTLRAAIGRVINNARPAICEDVARWARERGLPVEILHDAIFGEISGLGAGDPVLEREIQACEDDLRRPQALAAIEGAVVRELDGLVILPDGQFCLQGNWYRQQLETHYAYRRRLPYIRRRLRGDLYSLLSLWSATYYHWFHDTLPRLLYAQPKLPPGTRYLINEHPRGYQLDSLKAFGIGEADLEIQSSRIDTLVERLWFATPLGHASFSSADALSNVANRLKCHCGAVTCRPAERRVYISRAKAGRRQVTNEKQVVPVMRQHGFDVLCCEDLSLADQVRTFAQAQVVLGPHGAGLTNILYTRPGTRVGEFHGVESNSCFLVMSKQLGLGYSRFVAEDRSDGCPAPAMSVDAGRFSKWLDSLMQCQSHCPAYGLPLES
jgi:capsular polysaccharide biosynthesis protein